MAVNVEIQRQTGAPGMSSGGSAAASTARAHDHDRGQRVTGQPTVMQRAPVEPGSPKSKLGIAIVTFNRLAYLERTAEAVRALTATPHELIIADDGSDDGSVEWCHRHNLTVVTGSNRGVCWNKNRGLLALRTLTCDPILLLEDDIFPIQHSWEREWIAGTRQFDHLAYAHPKIAPQAISGRGTSSDPYVNTKATAQCTSVSARALDAVGFLDSRFRGYGVGHAEWTTRIKRAGFGHARVNLPDGRVAKANLYIEGGLKADDAPSFRDNREVEANRKLLAKIRRDPIHRDPWRTEDERRVLVAELASAGLTVTPLSEGGASG